MSRLFRALQNRAIPLTGKAILWIDGREVCSEDFPQETEPVRVFNRDFVAESVFPAGGGDLPYIFVLGKENIEKQKEVDHLKVYLEKENSDLIKFQSKEKDAERALDRFCIDRARLIKDTLRASGTNPYNNYDKAHFRINADEMAASGNATAHCLSEEDRDKLLSQHRATPKPKVREVTYSLPDFGAITSEVSEILGVTVVSAVIQVLKDDPPLSNWTRQGLRLHRDRNKEKCLFCEQPLPEGCLARLEAHFSDQYEELMQRLGVKIGELQKMSSEVSQLRIPYRAELYENIAEEYQRAAQRLEKTLKEVQQFLNAAVEVLECKKNRVFERMLFECALPPVDVDAAGRLNTVIDKHNQMCGEFDDKVRDARDRLAWDMIATTMEEFIKLRDGAKRAKKDIINAKENATRIAEEIDRLERNIVEHREPAEELNKDLQKYLGHQELSLEIKDTGYQITRNGDPANSLSEGEMTAIALLYFLKSLQDKSFNLKQGIVVLDDPVSSLDMNALYLAFGFIRERTKNAGQLFIFTHNFTFFRQVRNWFHQIKRQRSKDLTKRPARFYMMNCIGDGHQRCSEIAPLDPLLEEYESEYHYLFARIYRYFYNPLPAGLENNYILPNIARRVLEAFLAFRMPQIAGDLWEKLKNIDFDEAKKLRILRFVHTYSHADMVTDPEHDPSLLAEAPSVIKDLLELIKDQDREHFTAMEKLAKPSEEGDA